MKNLAQTFRYSLRQFGKTPAFTITAVLTLALGIGANIAVFSVTNAVLLNPSGVPHPDRVVALRAKYAMGDLANISMSAPDVGDAMDAGNLFSAVAAMQPGSFNYTPSGTTPTKINAARVTYRWFDVFEARPLLGRSFRPEEDVPGANHEVVLSYAAWKGRFGGDPNIVGRKLMFDEQPYEVVGVMRPDFNWPNTAEMWAPLGLKPERFHDANYRYNENLFAVGRMRQGVTVEQVNSYLNVKASQVVASEGAKSFGKASGWGMFSMPLIEFISGSLRRPLAILIGAVALVLLIACANIAGLQLARASARQREVSIQIALGAGRMRLLQQAFVESVVLAGAGALLGVLIANISIPLLLAAAPASLSSNLSVRLDMPVLLFVTVAGVICAILCGIAPAWHLTHARWFQSLQESGRSESMSKARQRLRSALVIGEIAVAMVLLMGAGLLVRSLHQLEQVQTGFDPRRVMSAVVSLPDSKYKDDQQQAAFYAALEDQLRAQPGVSDVAIADCVPFVDMCGSASFGIVGRPQAPNDPGPHGYIREISPDYFATLRIPVLRGRTFSIADREKTQPVAIVDDVLAQQYWPNQDPIGQYISLGKKYPKIEIVGIVAHARHSSLEADGSEGMYYLALAQFPNDSASIAVRTSMSDPSSAGSLIRNAVRAVDPNQPIYDLKTMQERVDESLVGRRFLVVLLSIFAGLSLLLSTLGLYGVINYGVKLRVREIGVRMALGAQRNDVLRLILRQGVRLAMAGLVLGLLGVFLAGRALSSLLYEVSLFNPVTLAGTSVLLAATVLLASYLPARRAAQLDPMRTLREE
ncbi:MAG: ABC transporter permease [Terriglobia bacterium]|nr:ABC transporter permease [Terriglobia bacterium]